MKLFHKLVKKNNFSPISLAVTSTLISFLYVLMEWLFIATSATFSYTATFFDKFLILLNSSAFLSVLAILCLIPFFILNCFHLPKKALTILRFIFALVPAIILASMFLLLIDNFTYNILDYGIVSTKGVIRVLYAAGYSILILVLLIPVIRITNTFEKKRKKQTPTAKKWFFGGFSAILLLLLLFPLIGSLKSNTAEQTIVQDAELINRPDIILITGDGINALKMSAYGYEKDTTPFLKEISAGSLVAQNAFSNAQGTIGSITSILTGKYPADIRVLAAKDILQGEDSFQHLPGILKDYGYYTVELNYSYYADAYKVNLQDGYIEANGQTAQVSQMNTALASRLPTNYYYFINEITTRITDRLAHIFFIKQMTNTYLQVTQATEKFNDQQKLDYAISLLENSDQPLFIEIHWMGTHGPKYYPEEQVFSAGEDPETQEKYAENFYLDSIREFDGAIAKLYGVLEENNLQDNTILVVGSDHTQKWSITRIPLLIKFPKSEYAESITSNVQNLDIAPTLLDYLGIHQPAWMPGDSLLKDLDQSRPIFLAAIANSTKDKITGKITYPEAVAPFYQFGKMSVIVCDHWYQADLLKLKLTDGKINSYNGTCQNQQITRKEALSLIAQHLKTYGFDTASLQSIDIDP